MPEPQQGYGVPTKDPKAFRTTPIDPVAGEVPNRETVRKFHTNADTDGNEQSLHHTLGSAKGQASPGDHDHRGGSSVALLQGVTITGSRSGGAALVSIIDILEELGATDGTTA